jgi:carbon storage regulator
VTGLSNVLTCHANATLGREPAALDELIGVLVLTRKPKQSIMIGDDVEVTVLSAHGETVRLGIQAPSDVRVWRTEIYTEIHPQRGEGGDREDVGSDVGDPRPRVDGPHEQG